RLTPLRNQAVSSVATAVGLKLLQSHDPQQARMILKKAIRLTPTNFRLYIYFLSTFVGSNLRDLGAEWRRAIRTRS
ncbi:MAG: hypothetical protein AB8G95_20285, partial [Anaerolineae bacterium]